MRIAFEQPGSPLDGEPPRGVRAIIGTLLLCICAMHPLGAAAGEALTVNGDGAQRSADIHWPTGLTPDDADLFAHNEITIQASCEVVWHHLTDAPTWPSWYSNAHNVVLHNGPHDHLTATTRFGFDTFGQHFEAHVAEFVPNTRLAWFGNGKDNHAYHPWLLESVPDGCHVITEESAKGAAAASLRERDPGAMHRGHDLWLASLKKVSEQAP